MGIMDWLIEKNNEAGAAVRGGLFDLNQFVGQKARDLVNPEKIEQAYSNKTDTPAEWFNGILGGGPGANQGSFKSPSAGGSAVTGGRSNTDYINGNFNQMVQKYNGGRGAFGEASNAPDYSGMPSPGNPMIAGTGEGGSTVDQTSALRDSLLAELGNKRSFEDLGFSATLDTSGIDRANKASQAQLADALKRAVGGISKARGTANTNYGNASKEIQNYYDANVEDVRDTKKEVQGDANAATNEMKANQAEIMKQLQSADAAMSEEAKLRGKATGGPRGGESDILQQAQGDIAATNSEQINNSVAEKGRRESQVDRNALALQSEGGNQVGNIEALLASVLTGYDTRESDVRTASANASASLGNQYAGQKLSAEQAQQQAVFNAQNQFQQSEDSRGMSILQMLLNNDQASQQADADAYIAEQEAQQKQMSNASKGDSKMQEMMYENYFKSLTPEKLAELVKLNSGG